MPAIISIAPIMRAADRERHDVAVARRGEGDDGPPHRPRQAAELLGLAHALQQVGRGGGEHQHDAEQDQHAGDRRAFVGHDAGERAEGGRVQPELEDPQDAEHRRGVGAGDAVAARQHDRRQDGEQSDQAGRGDRPACAGHGRRLLVETRDLRRHPEPHDVFQEEHDGDRPDHDPQPVLYLPRQLVDRQQDHRQQADAEHRQVHGPPPPGGRAGIGVAQEVVNPRAQCRGHVRHEATIGGMACELQRGGGRSTVAPVSRD